MKKIAVQRLTVEAFRQYGEYYDLTSASNGAGFYPDLLQLPMGIRAPLAVSMARVAGPRIIDMLEYHSFTSEGLMPMNGDCIIFVSHPLPGNHFYTEKMEAFYVPRNTFVRLNPGTVHGSQYVSDTESVDVLLLLPAFTYGNDTEVMFLKDEEKIEIIL